MKIRIAKSREDFDSLSALLIEYFKEIQNKVIDPNNMGEINELYNTYVQTRNAFILALENDKVIACVGLKKYTDDDCELKHLYVKLEFRGKKVANLLIREFIQISKKFGYKKIFLDTNPTMKAAINLYRFFEFKQVDPYRLSCCKDALYMALEI